MKETRIGEMNADNPVPKKVFIYFFIPSHFKKNLLLIWVKFDYRIFQKVTESGGTSARSKFGILLDTVHKVN